MPNDVIWPVTLVRAKPWYLHGFDELHTSAAGDVIYVDPNNTRASDTADNDGSDPEYPLATVARALALARPYMNDTIAVMGNGAWQYAAGVNRALPVSEEVEITVPGVRLVGVFPASTLGLSGHQRAMAGPVSRSLQSM